MAQQQAEPRIESFGLSKDIQNHVPEEERGQQQTQQARSGKRRTVAVNRRGPNTQRAAAVLDKESDDGADGSDAGDDLDASDTDDDPTSDADGDTEGADGNDDDDLDDGDTAGADDADDAGQDKAAARKARDVPDKDSKTRAQWRNEVAKLTGQMEAMQRQVDATAARSAQADDARQQRQAAAGDDDLDSVLDEVLGPGQDKDAFVKAGELEARGKQRKKLEKFVSGRVSGAVDGYVNEEAKAFMAVPGAREAYNAAVQSGAFDRLRGQHKHLLPLIFLTLKEQHDAQVKKLTARHEKELGALKVRLRRANLGEIPAGSGSRGNNGTGSGSMHPRNPMEAAMAALSQKQGLPAPRAAQRR
mgnify:CR=1 FL=1